MKVSSIATDLEKQKAGVWISEIPEMGDLRLKVRPLTNPDFERMNATLFATAERRDRDDRGNLLPETRDRILSKCLLETVLVDWENLTEDDGTSIPYTRECAETLLSDPAYKSFSVAVAWAAGAAVNRVYANREDDRKN